MFEDTTFNSYYNQVSKVALLKRLLGVDRASIYTMQ